MIDYDGRRFRGHAPDAPVAVYRQDGDVVWSEWSGGDVRRGSLAGTCDAEGTVSFAYCMVLTDGAVISGHSVNTPSSCPTGGSGSTSGGSAMALMRNGVRARSSRSGTDARHYGGFFST